MISKGIEVNLFKWLVYEADFGNDLLVMVSKFRF